MRYFAPLTPIAFFVVNPSGESFISLSSTKTALKAACGHTITHLPHWIHFSVFQYGHIIAIPRFSNFAVSVGTLPSGEKTETGSSFPSLTSIFFIILL